MTEREWRHGEIERQFIAWLDQQLAHFVSPIFVGLDGRSGSGKSTLANAVLESRTDTVVIEGDQFYAGGSAETWDGRSIEERASQVIDWRRQHAVLRELRSAGSSSWQSFDWNADDWDADTVPLTDERFTCQASGVVILEGAYSCRPELEDVLDARVLLAPPTQLRRNQLLEREGDAYRSDWEARWSAVEEHYFGHTMPQHRFDLVLDGM